MHYGEVQLGDVQPLVRQTVERREFVKRRIAEWECSGLISSEVAGELEETQAGHESGDVFAGAPTLWPELVDVVLTWRVVGEPVSVVGGMAVGVTDNRAMLYPARIAWLNENGVLGFEVRALLLEFWGVLDAEKYSCAVERLNRQLETVGDG